MFGKVGVANALLSDRMLSAVPVVSPGETVNAFAERVAAAAHALNLNMLQADDFILAAAHRSTSIDWTDRDESLYRQATDHDDFPCRHSIHYHGGPAGLEPGTELLPRRDLDCTWPVLHDFHDNFSAGNVYVTQNRDIASHYARDTRRHKAGAVYWVRVKAIRPDPLMVRIAQLSSVYHMIQPDYFLPWLFDSLVAEGATIVRGGVEPPVFVAANWF